MKKLIFSIIWVCLFSTNISLVKPFLQSEYVKEINRYTNNEIVNAIFIIEGGHNTKYPYGIKSISCDGLKKCKKICYTTIVRNKMRYVAFGYKDHNSFLQYLQSRYCPNIDEGCERWLPNLKYYLKKGE